MAEQVTVYFDGPEPPEGRIWCAVCAMQYKQTYLAANQAAIQMAQKPNAHRIGNPRFDITQDRGELKIAVVRSLTILGPQFGVMDVCWSHVVGLDMRQGLMPANPAEMAMFSQAAQIGGPR